MRRIGSVVRIMITAVCVFFVVTAVVNIAIGAVPQTRMTDVGSPSGKPPSGGTPLPYSGGSPPTPVGPTQRWFAPWTTPAPAPAPSPLGGWSMALGALMAAAFAATALRRTAPAITPAPLYISSAIGSLLGGMVGAVARAVRTVRPQILPAVPAAPPRPAPTPAPAPGTGFQSGGSTLTSTASSNNTTATKDWLEASRRWWRAWLEHDEDGMRNAEADGEEAKFLGGREPTESQRADIRHDILLSAKRKWWTSRIDLNGDRMDHYHAKAESLRDDYGAYTSGAEDRAINNEYEPKWEKKKSTVHSQLLSNQRQRWGLWLDDKSTAALDREDAKLRRDFEGALGDLSDVEPTESESRAIYHDKLVDARNRWWGAKLNLDARAMRDWASKEFKLMDIGGAFESGEEQRIEDKYSARWQKKIDSLRVEMVGYARQWWVAWANGQDTTTHTNAADTKRREFIAVGGMESQINPTEADLRPFYDDALRTVKQNWWQAKIALQPADLAKWQAKLDELQNKHGASFKPGKEEEIDRQYADKWQKKVKEVHQTLLQKAKDWWITWLVDGNTGDIADDAKDWRDKFKAVGGRPEDVQVSPAEYRQIHYDTLVAAQRQWWEGKIDLKSAVMDRTHDKASQLRNETGVSVDDAKIQAINMEYEPKWQAKVKSVKQDLLTHASNWWTAWLDNKDTSPFKNAADKLRADFQSVQGDPALVLPTDADKKSIYHAKLVEAKNRWWDARLNLKPATMADMAGKIQYLIGEGGSFSPGEEASIDNSYASQWSQKLKIWHNQLVKHSKDWWDGWWNNNDAKQENATLLAARLRSTFKGVGGEISQIEITPAEQKAIHNDTVNRLLNAWKDARGNPARLAPLTPKVNELRALGILSEQQYQAMVGDVKTAFTGVVDRHYRDLATLSHGDGDRISRSSFRAMSENRKAMADLALMLPEWEVKAIQAQRASIYKLADVQVAAKKKQMNRLAQSEAEISYNIRLADESPAYEWLREAVNDDSGSIAVMKPYMEYQAVLTEYWDYYLKPANVSEDGFKAAQAKLTALTSSYRDLPAMAQWGRQKTNRTQVEKGFQDLVKQWWLEKADQGQPTPATDMKVERWSTLVSSAEKSWKKQIDPLNQQLLDKKKEFWQVLTTAAPRTSKDLNRYRSDLKAFASDGASLRRQGATLPNDKPFSWELSERNKVDERYIQASLAIKQILADNADTPLNRLKPLLDPHQNVIDLISPYVSSTSNLDREVERRWKQEHPGTPSKFFSLQMPIANAELTTVYGAKDSLHTNHSGIDLVPHTGETSVRAAQSGKVVYAGRDPQSPGNIKEGLGNLVVVDHGDGRYTLYGHLANDSLQVKVGDQVSAGDLLGTMGNTGYSYGAHLHFGLYQGEWDAKKDRPWEYMEHQNPWLYLETKGWGRNFRRLMEDDDFLDTKAITLEQVRNVLAKSATFAKYASGAMKFPIFMKAGSDKPVRTIDVAEFIYDEAAKRGINPMVLLATVHKEASLLGGELYATNSDKVIWALAYGRSNDPKDWDWSKAGLDVQIQNAARRLKELFDDGAAKVKHGPAMMTGLHDLAGERSPEGRTFSANIIQGDECTIITADIGIENQATWALYSYTPHMIDIDLMNVREAAGKAKRVQRKAFPDEYQVTDNSAVGGGNLLFMKCWEMVKGQL